MDRNHTTHRALILRLAGALGFWASLALASANTISLAGTWRFQLDREDAGVAGRWFERPLSQQVKLPGALAAQGIGDEVSVATKWMGGIVDRSWFTAPEYEKYRQPGRVKIPFWLQPDQYYAGAAWYQRDLEVPAAWRGSRVTLSLERPHWETRVWVDNAMAGSNNALATPHEYDLGLIAPGKHRLTIRVDNRLVVDVGVDSHSVSDHTQGNWNGITGRLELRRTAPVWIDDLQVYPQASARSAVVRGRLGNATRQPGRGVVTLAVSPVSKEAAVKRNRPLATAGAARLAALNVAPAHRMVRTELPVTWNDQGGTFETILALGEEASLWDEFNPALYRLTAALDSGNDGAPATPRSVAFGLREISTAGTQFLVNGQKTFFRGTLECCIFPKTGYPPTDLDSWRRLIQVAKAHGLNLIRFHSWCPPEAAFAAADELGFYFHVECSSWANSSTSLGDGKPVDQWIYDEADRILRCYGNHPSFVLMPYGNEPGGKNHAAYLARWVNRYKTGDPRRLYTSGAGWPQIPENQFHLTPDPRVQAWGEGLKSRINAQPPETCTDYRDYIRARSVPVISHEIGQWCVYPNFAEVPKYTGYLKPKNFDIFRDQLEAHRLGPLARPFLLASGKLQTLCYKEDIESALRTPGMGGFELLDLHDFPGQGTALVGVLDPFWESKGYVTAAEYHRFCGSVVPLARLGKRVFTTAETLTATIEVAHFGPAPLENAVTTWRLVDDNGRKIAGGQLPARDIPVDNGITLGDLRIDLHPAPAPRRYRLVVALEGRQGAGSSRAGARLGTDRPLRSVRGENDWDVWVYPPPGDLTPAEGVTVAHELNDQALATLAAGGKVLLLLPPGKVKGDKLGRVELGFSSIFWNTAWTGRQPPHTLGILCDPAHPALAQFPTDYHSNWQWWYLVSRAGAMILDGLPPALEPTVRVIDDWVTARPLALMFEGKVGAGKLLVCSIDLERDHEQNPVARQMRHSLLDYMSGARFAPKTELTVSQVRGLYSSP